MPRLFCYPDGKNALPERGFTKNRKNLKNLLTNGERFGNLTKLSRGGRRGEAESLEAPGKEDLEGQKTRKKVLDKKL